MLINSCFFRFAIVCVKVDVIIACAGLGSRFLTARHHLPKALALIGGRPLLGYVLDDLMDVPRVETIIITAYGGFDLIKSYVETHPLSSRIKVVFDCSLSGFKQIIDSNLIESDHVVLMHGDNFYEGSLKPFFSELMSRKSFGVLTFAAPGSQNVGVFLRDANNRLGFFEKIPHLPADMASAAVLGISTKATKELASMKTDFFIARDVIPKILDSVHLIKHQGNIIDIGSPLSYRQCARGVEASRKMELNSLEADWIDRYKNIFSFVEEVFSADCI